MTFYGVLNLREGERAGRGNRIKGCTASRFFCSSVSFMILIRSSFLVNFRVARTSAAVTQKQNVTKQIGKTIVVKKPTSQLKGAKVQRKQFKSVEFVLSDEDDTTSSPEGQRQQQQGQP